MIIPHCNEAKTVVIGLAQCLLRILSQHHIIVNTYYNVMPINTRIIVTLSFVLTKIGIQQHNLNR